MRWTKKLLSMLVVSVFIMGMVSSVFAEMAPAPEPKIPEGFKFGTYTQKPWAGKTINVAMVAEPRADAIAKLAPEFEKLTGIKVNFNILAYPTLQEKQMVALTQGQCHQLKLPSHFSSVCRFTYF
jgi:ABC-type glycerol-3-phosphate transport system substrate-binding protein